MTLLAKSKPLQTLHDHTVQVIDRAQALLNGLPLSNEDRAALAELLWIAAAAHDIGKAASGFQAMLRDEAKDWNRRRHETLSTAFARHLPGITAETLFAILTHHRQIPSDFQDKGELVLHEFLPLGWIAMVEEFQQNAESALSLWNELCLAYNRPDLALSKFPDLAITLGVAEEWLDPSDQKRKVPFANRLLASRLRGLLVSADHLASAGYSPPPPIDLSGWQPKYTPRHFQECAGKVSGNLVLRAPTGSGKTEASLLWAQANYVPNARLFYVLPFTAAINAMHLRLQGEFAAQAKSVGVMHGRAAHHLYGQMAEDERSDPAAADREARGRAQLAREMYYSARVCTPHQILRYALRGRGWENMLSEMQSACFIFDEVHAYDAQLAGLTLGAARLLTERFGARVMFLSATLPKFLEKEIVRLIPADVQVPDRKHDSDREVLGRKRHRLSLSSGTLLDRLPEIVDAATAGENVLVVCNHVATAQVVWGKLRELSALRFPPEEVLLFHSRFTRHDRQRIEKQISGQSLPRILVATQVVEVSLDISFDRGYSEPAPIDALAQRFGRVNRKGDSPKPMMVVRDQISSHALYPPKLVAQTLLELSSIPPILSEDDLVTVCDRVYLDGFDEQQRSIFEERVNHHFFTEFEKNLVAGRHHNWVDDQFESLADRVECLPACFKKEYIQFRKDFRWLDADALLVDVRWSQVKDFLEPYSKDLDARIVKLPYSAEQGLIIPRKK